MRLADLVAGLSRLADLGFGFQAGESLRSAALAASLARELDLGDDEVRAALYTALLWHAGCVGYTHEMVRAFGDDQGVNLAAERTNLADRREVAVQLVPRLARGHAGVGGAWTALTRGRRLGQRLDTISCEVGRDAARRLGLEVEVQRGVYHSSEWWDGHGAPGGLARDDIPLGARVAAVSSVAASAHTGGGREATVDAVRRRAGTILDPGIVARFVARAGGLMEQLEADDPHEALLAAEPEPTASVLEPDLPRIAAVFGDLADLKSPFFAGHARAVATAAAGAGRRCRLSAGQVADLELAGLLHDVGRVAISNRVWDKPGPLAAHEWEQVRLHAYHSERIVSGSERLAPLALLVGRHHERCDGSGYHRGARRDEVSLAARILAVADAYHAMVSDRPHRPSLDPERAASQLEQQVRAGQMDGDAVVAVLAEVGHVADHVRPAAPAGLTDREIEVLRLVAAGCSNRGIATRLVISRRTAEDHVQRIYRKIGASSRAAAAMFAMEHDLVAPSTSPREDT